MRQPRSPRTNGICSPSTAPSAASLPSRARKRAKMKSSMTSSAFHARSAAREGHSPVRLPAPAVIGRKGLLPAAAIPVDGRPDEAYADRLALEAVVREEDADPAREAADQ